VNVIFILVLTVMNNNEIKKNDMTLNLLSAVDADSKITQRSLAAELGIALGLTNAYFKKCVDKGLVKIKQIPKNRYSYYLTKKGFTEKTRLSAEYLKYSFNFFRETKFQCEKIIKLCIDKNYFSIVLSDKSEFSEILILTAIDTEVNIIGVLGKENDNYCGKKVINKIEVGSSVDAIIMTKLDEPNIRYKFLKKKYSKHHIVVPKFLGLERELL
jgi:predicted transcriptional regulator